MGQQTTMINNVAKLSLLNLMGIFVSLFLTIVFIILSAHSMKYIKQFAVKIKVIVNRAEDKEMQLKSFNYQSRVDVQKNPTYMAMETVFKNEIKKSRSPNIFYIMGAYMNKYDHLVYYLFRNRLADKVDLLKPKSTFYVMLGVTTLCLCWISTILLVSLLQIFYKDVTTVTLTVFILFTIAIACSSSILSLIAINRFFRMYTITIKNAFKVDYGSRFVKLNQQRHQEYIPDDEAEIEQIKKYQEETKKIKLKQKLHQFSQFQNMDMYKSSVMTQRGLLMPMNDTQLMNSTRKLLGDDLDLNVKIRQIANEQIMKVLSHSSIQEQDDEEEEMYRQEQLAQYTSYPNVLMRQWIEQQQNQNYSMQHTQDNFVKKGQSPKGKSLKDLFPLQAHIEGMQHAPAKDKYIYVEDKHAIGDLDLLNNEAGKGENHSNTLTFIFMFAVILVSVVICCYLNYNFPAELSKAVFYMFAGGIVGDVLGFRIFFLLFFSFLKYCKALIQGYRSVQTNKKRELRNLMKTAVKELFYKKQTEFFDQFEIPPDELKSMEDNKKRYNKIKGKDQDHLESYYQTGNMADGFERQNTSMKHFPMIEENKEDELAIEINADNNYYGSGKRDDDGDGQKIPIEGFKPQSKQLFKQSPFLDMNENKSFEKTQTMVYNTQMPLINPTQMALSEKLGMKDDERYEKLMDKKQIVNELVDYNLLLLRKIYDAYEERAGKVLKNFREDKHNVIRKRYMVPVVNPNYDYEQLLREIEAQKRKKDNVEEDSVHLDGQTFCEDFEQQLMEHIQEEYGDNLIKEPIEREMIDKFGRKIDKNRKDVAIATPQPEKGLIEMEAEEEIVEDDADEWSKKMKELAYLRAKKKRGEVLTPEEEKRLIQLEKEEDQWRHKEIDQLEANDNRNNLEDQNLQQLKEEEDEYRNRRIGDLLDKQKREGLNQEETEELLMLQEWLKKRKRQLLEELRRKLANGTLTDEERRMLEELEEEERRRLEQLEEEEWAKKRDELERLRERLRNGEKLTDEEMRRLRELEAEERARLLKELEMLREKAKRGELTDEEKRRLAELEEWERQLKLKELENQENMRLNELDKMIEDLLAKGEENLTDEELLRLLMWRKEKAEIELAQMRRKGPPYTDEQVQDINDQEDLIEKLEYDILMLRKKMGLLTEEEEQRLKELETKFKMDDLSKIDHENEGQVEENENPFVDVENPMLGDENQNQFEEQNIDGEQNMNSYQDSEEHMYSRITDQENFAELPPVEVMNNASPKQEQSRPTSQMKPQNEQQQQEINMLQRSQTPQNDDNMGNNNITTPKSAMRQTDKSGEMQRVNTAKSGVRFQDDEMLRQQQQQLLAQEQLNNLAQAKMLAEQQELQRKQQELLEQQKKQLEDQNQKDLDQQQQHDNNENLDLQQNQQDDQQYNDVMGSTKKSGVRFQDDGENNNNNEDFFQRDPNEMGEGQLQQDNNQVELIQKQDTNKSGKSKKSNKSRANTSKSGQRSQNKSMNKSGVSSKGYPSQKSFDRTSNSKKSANSQKGGASGKSSGRKQQPQKLNKMKEDEELERLNMMSRDKMPSEIEFGHDDLEAPGGAGMDGEESIYSHKTSTILDEEKVSFMHIEHLPNQDNASDDSFSEQDMVYYNKDDLTNYSKGLGLNKVKARQPNQNQYQQQQYYSENDKNDIQEVNEGEMSDSGDSAYSLDDQGRRRRKRGNYGRGQIKHNDLEIQSYNDNIDGRVKVDDWNLNYRNKKKKLKKKKVDEKTKKRMHDLQSIYGVDARTLAGLQKGQFARAHPGKGKDGLGASRASDMSFRSTQNTFQKQSNQGGLGGNGGLPQTSKKSFDGQSNMFSFGGQKSVMSKRWNDIESTLKGNLLNQSKISKNAGGRNQSQKKNDFARKLPMSGMKKMTSTQQKFQKQKQAKNRQPGYLEEESKSDGSRDGQGRGGNKKQGKNNKRGYDSYSESDEGVNDQSAVFQSQDEDDRDLIRETRDNLNKQGQKLQMQNNNINNNNKGGQQSSNKKKGTKNLGMNDDDDHTESDEGVNDGNINFDGNDQDFLFKKRPFGEQSEMRAQAQNQQQQRVTQRTDSRYRSSNGLQMEDLEAQEFTDKRKGGKVTGKKLFTRSSDEEGIGSQRIQGRQLSNDRSGQKIIKYSESEFNTEYEKMSQKRGGDNNNNNNSAQKPPLNGQKRQQSQRRNKRDDEADEDQMRLNNLYGDPYNINGRIHPGVSKQLRSGLPAHGYTDVSDDEEGVSHNQVKFMNNNHQSDQELHAHSSQKFSHQNHNLSNSQTRFNRNGSSNSLLGLGNNNNNNNNSNRKTTQKKNSQQQNRRQTKRGTDGDDDDNDSYIIGPESNHSMVRSRGYQNNQGIDDDQYSIIHRERQIIEDLEANADNQFAKKRKIKRAANSTNYRNQNDIKLQQKMQERLRKRQMEAENALLSGADEERAQVKNLAKSKKKKQQKDWVRKEVNYWLDYDSPYAEYLVARFREWSPQIRGPQSRGGGSRQGSNKYNEVSHLYNVKANETSNSNQKVQQQQQQNYNSKPSSKSPQKKQKNSVPPRQKKQSNRKGTQKKENDRNVSKSDNEMVWNQPFQSKQINNLFAEDFEEEN